MSTSPPPLLSPSMVNAANHTHPSQTYFLKSHILAGEPRLTKDAPWKSYAWLTKSELQARLSEQKQNQWEDVRPVFGARD